MTTVNVLGVAATVAGVAAFLALSVRYGQGDRVMCSRADTVDGAAARFNPHKVVPEVVKLLLHARLSCPADSDNANHGSNPNGDAENCQDAAHLVAEQRDQCGAE